MYGEDAVDHDHTTGIDSRQSVLGGAVLLNLGSDLIHFSRTQEVMAFFRLVLIAELVSWAHGERSGSGGVIETRSASASSRRV